MLNRILNYNGLCDPTGDAGGGGGGATPASAMDILDSLLTSSGDTGTGTDQGSGVTQPATSPATSPTTSPSNMIEVPDDEPSSTLDSLLDDVIPEVPGEEKSSGEKPAEGDKKPDTEEDSPDGSDGKRYFMTKTKYERMKSATDTINKLKELTNVDITNPENLQHLQSVINRGTDFVEMTRDYLNVEGGSPTNFASYLLSESQRVEKDTGFDPVNPSSGGISPARTLVIELLAQDENFANQLTAAAGSDYLLDRFASIYTKHANAPANSDGESIRASVEWLCQELGIDTKLLSQNAQNSAARRAEQLERENMELKNRHRSESASEAYRHTDVAISKKTNDLVDNFLKSTAPRVFGVKHSDSALTQLADDVRLKVVAQVRQELKNDPDFRRKAQLELTRLKESGGKSAGNLVALYEARIGQMLNPSRGAIPEIVKSQFALFKTNQANKLKTRASTAAAVSSSQPSSRVQTGDPAKVIDFKPREGEDNATARLRALDQILNS